MMKIPGFTLYPITHKKKEFQEIDYRNLKELPKDLIAVSFPSERILDRIGWNRKYGFDLTHGLKRAGLTLRFKAKNVPWHETLLPGIIRDNLEKQRRQNEKGKYSAKQGSPKQQKGKGRKM